MPRKRSDQRPIATLEQQEIVRANIPQREETIAPGFVSIYTNDTQFLITPWDVRLTFGEISNVSKDPPSIAIKVMAEVRMSPQHAKKVLNVLQHQIEHYEKTVGPIPMPREVSQRST